MYIAMTKIFSASNKNIYADKGKPVCILDTVDGVVNEVSYKEAVDLCVSKEVKGLKYEPEKDTLWYKDCRIDEALCGDFCIKPFGTSRGHWQIDLFGAKAIDVVAFSNLVLFCLAPSNVLLCGLGFDDVLFNDIKEITCPWFEKVGSFYRAVIEVRVTIDGNATRVPRVDLFLLFDSNGNICAEEVFYSDSSRAHVELRHNDDYYGSTSKMKGAIAMLKVMRPPIVEEFDMGWTVNDFRKSEK